MTGTTDESDRARRIAAQDAEFEHWCDQVGSTPDVRLDLVRATRAALRDHRYDDPDILECTVQRVSNDLGVMCRGEWRDEEPIV